MSEWKPIEAAPKDEGVVSIYVPDNPIFDRHPEGWTPPPPPADLVERAVSLWGYAALIIMKDGTFRLTCDTEDAFHNETGDIVSPEFAAAVIKEFEHAAIIPSGTFPGD